MWEEWSNDALPYTIPFQGGAQIFEIQSNADPSWSWQQLVLMVFWVGAAISLSKLLKDLISLWTQISKYPKLKSDRVTKVSTDYPHMPFSFFNYVFVSDKVFFKEEEWNRMLTHEISHVQGWHSLDILFIEILSAFFWWNPLIFWYRKSLQATHEFIADAQVLKSTDTEAYGSLLLSSSQSALQLALANHFINSQLKNRIQMMMKIKSNPFRIWKYALVFPLLGILLVLFAYRVPESPSATSMHPADQISYPDSIPSKIVYYVDGKKVTEKDIQSIDPSQIDQMNVLKGESAEAKYGQDGKYGAMEIILKVKTATQQEKTAYDFVDSKAEFPGGDKALSEYLGKNLLYPATAKESKLEGLVVVKILINSDGTVSHPKIIKSLGKGCDDEALRVVSAMPRWNPGLKNGKAVEQSFVIPIKFKISNDQANQLDKINDPSKEFRLQPEPSYKKVYDFVELKPEYPGGDKELMQFIAQNIKYPESAKSKGIEGTVITRFVISKTGTVEDARIVKSFDRDCELEALRVVNKLPNWIPGKNDGVPVDVLFTLPIKFKLMEPQKSYAIIQDKPISTSQNEDINLSEFKTREDGKGSLSSLKVMPNPASRQITVLYHNSKNIQIDILDMQGRVVHQSAKGTFNGTQVIDLSKLQSGTYIVRVNEGGKISDQKIIVQ
mgnify:CR=1 FL=1